MSEKRPSIVESAKAAAASAAKKAAIKGAESLARRADAWARDSVESYARFRDEIDRWVATARPYLEDPSISVGTKAAIRTALNAGIAIGDLFPGYGLVLSGGADAAKVVAYVEYEARRFYVRWMKNGDPDDVKLSVFDLTPDVSLRVALLTEFLEITSAGFAPTHAVEGAIQLYHDWPRMKRAIARVREIAAEQAEISAREAEAMAAFGIAPDEDLEIDTEEHV